MSIAFVHLSDIHFGQEKGGVLVVHTDVKLRLVEDVRKCVRTLPGGFARGVIVSGDIAFAGKSGEYIEAGAWLDEVAKAAGCAVTAIQLVPGNHDVDRDEISPATELMLNMIAEKGESELDMFLANDRDRELFYARFSGYEPFAHGYNSPLDKDGGNAGDRTVELAPGRFLRFIGLNTALICSRTDKEGRLLLGARQRVLPRTSGQELVVIAHHPLRWLQDSDDSRRYLTARARVFITGHDHSPSVCVERVGDGCDLLLLAAGATVPPTANNHYTYTYNILEFEWDPRSDDLVVTVHPRAWSEVAKDFEPDVVRLGGEDRRFQLASPNFRLAATASEKLSANRDHAALAPKPVIPPATEVGVDEGREEPSVSPEYSLLLLRFFRNLTSAQRMSVLVSLKALPPDWRQPLTHGVERHILDSLKRSDRLEELETAINEIEAHPPS